MSTTVDTDRVARAVGMSPIGDIRVAEAAIRIAPLRPADRRPRAPSRRARSCTMVHSALDEHAHRNWPRRTQFGPCALCTIAVHSGYAQGKPPKRVPG
jgi:hypothetical protein